MGTGMGTCAGIGGGTEGGSGAGTEGGCDAGSEGGRRGGAEVDARGGTGGGACGEGAFAAGNGGAMTTVPPGAVARCGSPQPVQKAASGGTVRPQRAQVVMTRSPSMRSIWAPTWMRSPSLSARGDARRSPFTHVPLVLPRSSISQASPSLRMTAWRLEQPWSSSWRVLPDSRPKVIPSDRGI